MKTLRQQLGRLLCPSNHLYSPIHRSFFIVHEPFTLARRVFARPSASAQRPFEATWFARPSADGSRERIDAASFRGPSVQGNRRELGGECLRSAWNATSGVSEARGCECQGSDSKVANDFARFGRCVSIIEH